MKTYAPKAGEVDQAWYIVDADGKTLGRLASDIARVLHGKHKRTFTPNQDHGDFVIVINASKIAVTGNKLDGKVYYRHSGYPGGLKSATLGDLLQKRPELAIEKAVRGMLPKNRLGEAMFGKLKVYAGSGHPHEAQKPRNLSEVFAGQTTGARYGADEGTE